MRCWRRRRRAHYSGSQGDDCVEVAIAEQVVHVRDSKDVTRPDFVVGHEEWSRFMGFVSDA
ncbi:DUF397 domain-containing protein [Streptomyces sp. NBC_01233]|uniref:DUF397 domain-containing protein n=1 Tax=Streptomyces sp. NBC_01233 TaxID=2903787 RepID=UPI002E0E6AB8|nr:DUF397 domain-containing protein [Streptomyces sp. NBC_01233]